MRSLLAAAFAIPLAADLLDQLIAWARARWQIAVAEYNVIPEFRLVLWVRMRYDNPSYDHDLLILKLPSYEWERCDYKRKWCWHQRHLYRRGRSQNEGGGMGIALVPVT